LACLRAAGHERVPVGKCGRAVVSTCMQTPNG